MITFNQVDKSFTEDRKAVKGLSFTIERGEFFVLIGPSGCGKTTTLKMINRLVDASSGTITINGSNHTDVNMHELRWNIGYVLQQIALFPHLTVAENIAVVPEMKKWKQDDIQKRVNELLELVGMDPETYRDRLPADLSGGQQQRVGVARALAGDPDIILMDEPFSALDPLVREQLQKDIKALQQRIKKTIVFVTHDMNEATLLGDRIGMMEAGVLLQVGTADELKRNPATPAVEAFIGRSVEQKNLTLKELLTPSDRSEYIRSHRDEQRVTVQFIINENDEWVTTYDDHKQLDAIIPIDASSSVRTAFEVLENSHLPALPVQENGKLIGSVSYKDLARALV
ncbi:hypothetical protein DH09_11595 [Bacillaceae bacterium JMAK1]|nr:hypothetical protein DH09_11595 [Bacillaceae bacterium JMAK1]